MESDIQKEVIDYLKAAGWLVFRMNAGRARMNMHLCPAGTPDLLAVSPRGFYLWIEVKTKKGEISLAQAAMHETLLSRRCLVTVVRCVEDIAAEVRSITGNKK